eukprot:g49207.t1
MQTLCLPQRPYRSLPAADSPLRQWSLPKLIGELIWPASMSQRHLAFAVNRLSVFGHQAFDVAYSMVGRVYRHLREERGLFSPRQHRPAKLRV